MFVAMREYICTVASFLVSKKQYKTKPKSNKSETDRNRIDVTHLPMDKMATISQEMVSGAFSWIKSFVFWSKFHKSLFLRVQSTIIQHWFR